MGVVTLPSEESISSVDCLAVITCSKESGNIDAEFYSIVSKSSAIDYCLQMISSLYTENSSLTAECACCVLSSHQSEHLFHDLKGTKILLVGLSTGHLFCVPFLTSSQNYAMKSAVRLIYQSQWPIDGIACPQDGQNVFLFLQGGIVLALSPNRGDLNLVHQRSLCYNALTLPISVKSFCVPKCYKMVVSDSLVTNLVHVVSPEQADIDTIPVKGVTALSAIPGANTVIASTLHNEFYLLDCASLTQKKDQTFTSLAGCNLDISLQLIQDMKKETELLHQFRKELEVEDSIIKALSLVARAPILFHCFKIVAEVIANETEEMEEEEEFLFSSATCSSNRHMSQISVEIHNRSSENFDPMLWKINLEIINPDGTILAKDASLLKTFNEESPFSTVVNIAHLVEKLPFPISVRASLVAEIKEKNSRSQWLKISLGSVELDISHFFSVSFQPPQLVSEKQPNLKTFLNEMSYSSKTSLININKEALITHYVIPIPDELRQPKLILEKLLLNCRNRHNFSLDELVGNQGDKTVIWIQIFQNTVKLAFRKSCSSITLSSTSVEVLHAVKLCLTSMLRTGVLWNESLVLSDVSFSKAKSLSAVLETLALDEIQNSKQLLIIHQDLRNNVSSHIH